MDARPVPLKKIYHVRVVIDTVVAADNADQAKKLSHAMLEDIVENDCAVDPPMIKVVGRITTEKDLPKGWTKSCLPWGKEEREGLELGVVDYL